MKMFVILFLFVCCPLVARAADPEAYYRVWKPPLDDYEGIIPVGSPPPGDSITVIDADGNKQGPFYRTNGYAWVTIPRPSRMHPLFLTSAEVHSITNSLPLGGNYVAFVNSDTKNVAISSELRASSVPEHSVSGKWLKGVFGDSTFSALKETSTINLTYAIQRGTATATLSIWDTKGQAQSVSTKAFPTVPAAFDTIHSSAQ
jgi:hypothetical protein